MWSPNRLPIAIVVLLFLLAGCTRVDAERTTAAPVAGAIEIVPPAGTALPMARLLAQSVVDAITRRGGVAHLGDGLKPGNTVGFVVTGWVEGGDASGDGRVATVEWQVHARKQAFPVTSARLPVYAKEQDWVYGSPALVRAIGDRTAAMLTKPLGLESEAQATVPSSNVVSEPAADNDIASPESPAKGDVPSKSLKTPPDLWVDEVTGAPGDGNRSLTAALREILRGAGYPLARSPSGAMYFVQASVDVSVIDHSTEHITIVWSMVGRDGSEIGRISQNNDIPRGMLHDTWGETARYAARGGFEGVRAILRELGYGEPIP